jgi:hypothetical protein
MKLSIFNAILSNLTQISFLPNADETTQKNKNKNIFHKCVLELNLATINGLGGSNLYKKNQNRCNLMYEYASLYLRLLQWMSIHGSRSNWT